MSDLLSSGRGGDGSVLQGNAEEAQTVKEGIQRAQREICHRFGSPWTPAREDLKVGIAANVSHGLDPINGLRHPPEGETTGWYIWAGDAIGSDDDFFEPVHVEHLPEICPAVLPYLGLAPGWRFLIAPGYEDVWFDASLLDVSAET
jgi:hypothetical protein